MPDRRRQLKKLRKRAGIDCLTGIALATGRYEDARGLAELVVETYNEVFPTGHLRPRAV